MMYIVTYMAVTDCYKDSGAFSATLGIFTNKNTAFIRAIQEYISELLQYDLVEKEEIEKKLLGSPQVIYERLHAWRDKLWIPEFTREPVGPFVFIEEITPQKHWNLQSFLDENNLKKGGILADILTKLSKTDDDQITQIGVENLLAKIKEGLDFHDALLIVENSTLTAAAQQIWKLAENNYYLEHIPIFENARQEQEQAIEEE
jgi:hypothetical protein